MNVLPDAQELEVQQAVAEFLMRECPPAMARQAEEGYSGHSPHLWKKFADLGWLTLCLPEDVGGQGLPLPYLGLMLEQVGQVIAPLPVLGTMASALVIDRHGSAAQRALLNQVGTGELILSYAAVEASGAWNAARIGMTGRRDGEEIVLSGTKHFVENFAVSGLVLVAFRLADPRTGANELAAILVDTRAAGISATQLRPMAKDGEYTVSFDQVRVPATQLLGGGAHAVHDLMNYAAVFTVSQMQGAARQAMLLAVDHVNNREAFGQPIGAFQAIQHMAADMMNAVDGSQLLAREAIWRLGNGLPADAEISQAKSFANEQCLKVCRSAQQMFGGMGFITICDINLWFRRVASWSLRCGTTYEHRERIAAILLDQAGTVRLDHAPSALATVKA
jgi:alkylation response protein AidB-like acyl-CoA dehydrogenase